MAKDSFLDTNVIFHYSNYCGEGSGTILTKCYLFIKNKKGRFILCGAVLRELSQIIDKRVKIHKAVINKIRNRNFELETILTAKDVPYAKKLYEQFKNKNIEKVSLDFANQRHLSEIKIEKFLKTGVDEEVLPFGEVDKSLINKIYDIIFNHADCKILTSAMQIQNGRALFFFVTADARDFSPNNYEYLKQYFEMNYRKENHKFPELLNLLFTN